MRVVSCLVGEHNLWLVALAAAVCVAGSWISFNLFHRARERAGMQMHGWTFLTAVAAGSSIWCTHFIAMLAYQVSAPVSFDPLLTVVSLMVAIAGCGLGFGLGALNDERCPPEVCGAIIGVSIALMHYTGMAAYHVTGLVEWDGAYIAASVLISATLAAYALREAVRRPRPQSPSISIGLFVLAIVGLHFTGMAAVQVTPMALADNNTDAFEAIAVAVAVAALLIIGTGVVSHLIDEHTSMEAFARLQHLALNDALTGLPNRVHFGDYLEQELERARANAWQIGRAHV